MPNPQFDYPLTLAEADPQRFKERVGKLVKHKPVEKPE